MQRARESKGEPLDGGVLAQRWISSGLGREELAVRNGAGVARL